jgi:hypothetical protein
MTTATKSKAEGQANRRLQAAEFVEKISETLRVRTAEKLCEAGKYDEVVNMCSKLSNSSALKVADGLIKFAEQEKWSHKLGSYRFVKQAEEFIERIETAVYIYGDLYKRGEVSVESVVFYSQQVLNSYKDKARGDNDRDLNEAEKTYKMALKFILELRKKYGIDVFEFDGIILPKLETRMPKLDISSVAILRGELETEVAKLYDHRVKISERLKGTEIFQIRYLKEAMKWNAASLFEKFGVAVEPHEFSIGSLQKKAEELWKRDPEKAKKINELMKDFNVIRLESEGESIRRKEKLVST